MRQQDMKILLRNIRRPTHDHVAAQVAVYDAVWVKHWDHLRVNGMNKFSYWSRIVWFMLSRQGDYAIALVSSVGP